MGFDKEFKIRMTSKMYQDLEKRAREVAQETGFSLSVSDLIRMYCENGLRAKSKKKV